ncbi:cationic amino acid transporter 3 isoform X2 [Halyomorpha halys]|uniref:cationic amino acid transporter 3 isoform X2 n=1 Tax=Halyomorpha halys TaxID=286706 RepID=UPI0034D1B33A
MGVFHNIKAMLLKFLKSLVLRKQVIVLPLSPLQVTFSTLDAIMICLGSMIGHGFHNSLGVITQRYGIMSFFCYGIGGLIMITIAMCYAELSCLSPTAGNAYHYCYNTMGELFGFLVGWLMILSYGLELMVAARYLSLFIDHNFFEGRIGTVSRDKLSAGSVEGFDFYVNSHPDIMSVLVILVVAGRAISLTRESITATNVMTSINISTILIIIVIYIFSINYPVTKHYLIPKDLSSEETENPTINVPRSIMFSCKASVIIYCSVSLLHCLVWPVNDVDTEAPFIYVMTKLNCMPMNWLCALASILGHLSSAHAFMFLLTRLLYTMARDGLIFSLFGHINRNTNTPIFSTFVFTFILGAVGMYLRPEYMWTIARASGIISKEVIAICILIRRYRCEDEIIENDTLNRWVLINYPRSLKNPSKETEKISMLLIANAVLCIMGCGIFLRLLIEESHVSHTSYRAGFMIFLILFCFFAACLVQQPQNNRHIYYTVRGVPLLPLTIIGVLEIMGWDAKIYPRKEIGIWLLLGVIFYLSYSRRNSIERSFLYPNGKRWGRLQISHHIERHIVNIIPDTADPNYIKFMRAQRRRNVKSRLFHDSTIDKELDEIEMSSQVNPDDLLSPSEQSDILDESSYEDLDDSPVK